MEDGMFASSDGACCDSSRATDGGRCAGGCSMEELMMAACDVDSPMKRMALLGCVRVVGVSMFP
jgi:hypothetical protein